MARMYPKGGSTRNESYQAEPMVYRALETQLSDTFVVIHSVRWLAQVARDVDGRNVPVGEIDFLILHPLLGILALEIKGGRVRIENNYVVFANGDKKDPISQVGRGVYALSRWIADAGGPYHKIGYAVVFPQSMVKGRSLPPAFYDITGPSPQCICLDRSDLDTVGDKAIHLMQYWKSALGNPSFTPGKMDQIIKLLLPDPDFTPTWMERISITSKKYLQLTEQQSVRLRQIEKHQRYVLTGRSGTGKTLIAVERARRLARQGKMVLLLVYNVALRQALSEELKEGSGSPASDLVYIDVMNFHALCREAAMTLERIEECDQKDWVKYQAFLTLVEAIDSCLFPDYDALIIDEAQVFHAEWLKKLDNWFANKPILVCCDETQVFSYEHKTTADQLCILFHVANPFHLLVNMRSPLPVFNRLQQVVETTYEQISLREDEPDSLEEIITEDPLQQLQASIQQLDAEGVPPKSILVIYLYEDPFGNSREGLTNVQSLSVFRCRGLEAPVVIVYVDRSITDDIVLACAYTRATNRCIAIYNRSIFLIPPKSKFATILSEEHEEIKQRQKATVWPSLHKWSLTPVVLQEITLYWSQMWRGWLLLSKQEKTVPFELWILHILYTSPDTLYVGQVYGLENQSPPHYLTTYTIQTSALHEIKGTGIMFLWCESCLMWSIAEKRPESEGYRCLGCAHKLRHQMDQLFSEQIFPETEASIPKEMERYQLLSTTLMSSQLLDERDTVFAYCLQLWYHLTLEQRERLNMYCCVLNVSNIPLWIARILTGMEIVTGVPSQLLDIRYIEEKHWKQCQWLALYIDRITWHKVVASNMGTWFTRKWIEKQEKGVYRILSVDE